MMKKVDELTVYNQVDDEQWPFTFDSIKRLKKQCSL